MHRCVTFFRLIPLASALAVSVAFAVPSALIVTTTADPALGTDDGGHCTLREALHAASTNATSGSCPAGVASPAVDTIAFDIPDTDAGCVGNPKVCTIKPTTTLDTIDGPVFIDGYTQPNSHANTLPLGNDAAILIELDGTNLAPILNLSGTAASGSTIRGLALTHVSNVAIRASHVDNVTVTGNFIGTDASGTTSTSNGPYGIYADSGDATVIGGSAPAQRNVFAGVTSAIFLEGSSNSARETNCVVQGNYIGIDKTGTVPLAVISGIQLRGTTDCQIGGSASGAGNVVGAATQAISVDAEFTDGGPINTTIQGNLVGTDATGTVRLGQYYGLVIGTSTGTVLGGTATGEGNLISGNAADGILFANSPTGALVQGNKIGTDISGQLPLGNGWCGIEIGTGNTADSIGGTVTGSGNIIAFNGTNGILVGGSNTVWSIEGNSIYANNDLGISVLNGRCDDHSSHPTDNDPDDIDTGPNDVQNYPVFTSVTINPKTTAHIAATLNSTANSMFHVEFFANASCDDSNPVPGTVKHAGEGKFFIGSIDVATIGNNATIGPLDITVPAHRHVITANATAADGSTSEFSVCSDQDSIFTDGYEGD